MGTEQYHETYAETLSYNSSPAMKEMVVSVRPKIYAIRQILDREHEMYEKTLSRYKSYFNSFNSDSPDFDPVIINSI